MNRTNSLIAFLLLPLCSLAQFTYERKVSEVTQSGWYRISLPAELLPKLKTDFADIRLYSSSNNQIFDSIRHPTIPQKFHTCYKLQKMKSHKLPFH